MTRWSVARQAPLSMEFPRQEYWSGLPFPSPGDLPDSGTEPASPALAGRFFTPEPLGKALNLRLEWIMGGVSELRRKREESLNAVTNG